MLYGMLLLVLTALGADDGFVPSREAGDCVYTERPRSHAEGSAMRAVCTWAEVDPVGLNARLRDFDSYEELIWVIDQSEVRRTDPAGRLLVYQLQQLWGLNDREVLLWAWTESVPDGERHRWVTATAEPLPPRKSTIRTPKNEGYWEVRANPDGPGSVVTHQIAVDAGGMPLPAWLVRWARTRGFARVMSEVRAAVHAPK